MFRRVLVANRGEIALRVIRTCRTLGIDTVAVFSDADAREPHVRAADDAVRVGAPPATDSYLATERVLDAALRTGAEAVHPGYGFLAENPDFAEACAAKGLVFVGPRPDTIRLMGDKAAAKRHLEAAGVPVVPGVHGADLTDADLAAAAERVGYPLLLKPAAGGGGKGMRRVDRHADLAEAVAAARREARSAFGDPRLIVERYVDRPRHVEVQIFGDEHGNLVHLYERECSVQRRHQKVVEETPSPALDDDLRRRMLDAALAAARSVGYVGAGTVEMLLSDATGEFFFLEMNTRLQVEHPVTEMTTGTDLVAWQLLVAAGEPLPATQDDIRRDGHAIEARVYAEDPAAGFLPQVGEVVGLVLPSGPGVRVDAGVAPGSGVGAFYDPMLAKVVVHGRDRAEAAARMLRALRDTAVLGVTTNVGFLHDVVAHPAFAAGRTTTGFATEHLADWRHRAPPPEALAAAAAALLGPAPSADPWAALGPWRVAGVGGWRPRLRDRGGGEHALTVGGRRGRLTVAVDAVPAPLAAAAGGGGIVEVEADGRRTAARVGVDGGVVWVHVAGATDRLEVVPATRRAASGVAAAGALSSPMPGTVTAVDVAEGDRVEAGATLVVVEAMKMEHPVRAPTAGRVTAVHVAPGDAVAADAPLVAVAADPAEDDRG